MICVICLCVLVPKNMTGTLQQQHHQCSIIQTTVHIQCRMGIPTWYLCDKIGLTIDGRIIVQQIQTKVRKRLKSWSFLCHLYTIACSSIIKYLMYNIRDLFIIYFNYWSASKYSKISVIWINSHGSVLCGQRKQDKCKPCEFLHTFRKTRNPFLIILKFGTA